MRHLRLHLRLAFVALSCCCGHKQLFVSVPPNQLLTADPVPSALPSVTIEPSSGPLLETGACSRDSGDMVASLRRYENAAAQPKMSLFRDLSPMGVCAAYLATAEQLRADPTTCSGSGTDPDTASGSSAEDFETALSGLNNCLVAAASDPNVGAPVVQAALGRGVLGHVEGSANCAETGRVAETLGLLDADDGNLILNAAHHSADCVAAVNLVRHLNQTCSSITSYVMDACLIDVEDDSARSMNLVTAVLGRGPFSRESTTNSGDISKCPDDITKTLASTVADAVSQPAPGAKGESTAGPKASPVLQRSSARNTAEVCQRQLKQATDHCTKGAIASAPEIRAVDVCTIANALEFKPGAANAARLYRDNLAAQAATATPQSLTINVPRPSFEPVTALPPQSTTSNVLNGLADFLVARAKDEVQEEVATAFTNVICQHEVNGVAVASYFPNTCKVLKGRFLDGKVSLQSFGSTVQKSLESDLMGLLPTLLNASRTGADATLVRALPHLLLPDHEVRTFFAELATAPCDLDKIDPAKPPPFVDEVGCVDAFLGDTYAAYANAKTYDPSPRIARWVAVRLPDDRLQRMIVELAPIYERAATDDPFELLKALEAALDHHVDNKVVLSLMEQRFGPLLQRFTGLGDLANVMMHGARAISEGQNLAQVFLAATSSVQACSGGDPTAADLSCALELSHVAVSVFMETRERWKSGLPAGPEYDAYISDVAQRISRLMRTRPHLKAWAEHRFFAIQQIAISDPTGKAKRLDIRTFIGEVLRALVQIDGALPKPTDQDGSDDARAAHFQQLLSLSGVLVRAVIANSMTDSPVKTKALAIVDDSLAIASAAYQHKLAEFAADLYSLADRLGMPEPFPGALRPYMPLATALATAKTPDEAKAAFEKYVPPDNYKLKHEPGSHVTLTGLVGAGGGFETGVSGAPGTAGTLALFVPVGVDLTWGGCHGCGFMLGALDLGSITTLRLSDNVSTSKDVSLGQVLAPGIYVRFPLWGPVVWGGGASLAPGIRQGSGDDDKEAVWRVMGFVSVDVTLLRL